MDKIVKRISYGSWDGSWSKRGSQSSQISIQTRSSAENGVRVSGRSLRDAKMLAARRGNRNSQTSSAPSQQDRSSIESKVCMSSVEAKLDRLLKINEENLTLLKDAIPRMLQETTSKLLSPSFSPDPSDIGEAGNEGVDTQNETTKEAPPMANDDLIPLPNTCQGTRRDSAVRFSIVTAQDDSPHGSENEDQLMPLPKVSRLSTSSPRASRTSVGSGHTIARHVESASKRSAALHHLWSLLEEPESVQYGTCFTIFWAVIIFASVQFPLLQLSASFSDQSNTTTGFELAIDILFTIETLLRFVAYPHKLAFFKKFLNIIDAFAGLPPLVLRILALSLTDQSQIVENMLACIVPVLRLLKFIRRFEKFHLLLKAFHMLLDALPVLMYCLAVILLTFAAFFFLVEPRSNVPTFGTSLYVATITLTTVGYGDVTPESAWGELLVCGLSIVSMLYMAMPLGIIGTAFSTVWEERDRVLILKRTRSRMKEMGLGPEQVPSLFRHFDKDRDGQLSSTEFHSMVSELRLGIRSDRIIQLFMLIDQDGNGNIDDEEFMRTLFPTMHARIYSSESAYESSDDQFTQTLYSVMQGPDPK